MPLTAVLSRLMSGSDLDVGEARTLMQVFADGNFDPIQAAGVLVALQVKGASSTELAGMAEVLRDKALQLDHQFPNLVDTCGTGGGRPTFNLSTGAAIVAAASGAMIAKHGNRSVTSKCGGVDVLEALGVRMQADPDRLSKILESTGIVFLFAPNHHGSMKGLGPVRKSLGVRTVFNQLGPLANPAGAKRQLIGVYEEQYLKPMAEALVLLGAQHAFVVRGQDGTDEVSPCAPTSYAEVEDGRVKFGEFKPTDFGIEELPHHTIIGGEDIETNARLLMAALDGSHPELSSALVPNAALAMVLSRGKGSALEAGKEVRESIEKGDAVRKLMQVIEVTSY